MSILKRGLQQIRPLWPKPMHQCKTEPWQRSLVVVVAAMLVAIGSQWLLASPQPVLIASMAASAVLVFIAPNSPFAQAWPVIGGNLVAAALGVLCAQWQLPFGLAAVMALALSLIIMFYGRCLHPPSAGLALAAAVIPSPDYSFVYGPVLINSILLVVAGNLIKGLPKAAKRRQPQAAKTAGIPSEVITPVLELCRDWMQEPVLVLKTNQSLEQALELLLKYRQHCAPVVDEHQYFQGFLSWHHCVELCQHPELRHRMLGAYLEAAQQSVGIDARLEPWLLAELSVAGIGFAVLDAEQRLQGVLTEGRLLSWYQQRLPQLAAVAGWAKSA